MYRPQLFCFFMLLMSFYSMSIEASNDCEIRCGENTECKLEEFSNTAYCWCKKGYTGNPLKSCFKLDEKSPCNPNPCGPNSECIEKDDKIGPHCRCLPNLYEWPPNCRTGCETHNECANDELCDIKFNKCLKVCDPSPCGENSVCRVDKKKAKVYCSCLKDYIAQRDFGCRKKTTNDEKVPIELIISQLKDVCDGKCGDNAYCDREKKQCQCTQGYQGDPLKSCDKLIQPTGKEDPCNPNLCGNYSTCSIVEGKASCSCLEGYGYSPYCSPCTEYSSCENDQLCVGGRCTPSPCASHCGYDSTCNIFNGTLECNCGDYKDGANPFNRCFRFYQGLSPVTIAILSG